MTVRDSIVAGLRAELIGPEDDSAERLDRFDSPRIRYGAGILFPKASPVPFQEDDNQNATPENSGNESSSDINGADDAGSGLELTADHDEEVNRANDYLPSAMGITVRADLSHGLKIHVRSARYQSLRASQVSNDPGQSTAAETQTGWERVPIRQSFELPADQFRSPETLVIRREVSAPSGGQELSLHILVRKARPDDQSDHRFVTVTLLNNAVSSGSYANDEHCFFQCALQLEPNDGIGAFLPLPERATSAEDDVESRSAELLFRHRKTFGVGHGVATDWFQERDGSVSRVWTDTLPTYEIRPILPREFDDLDFRMELLTEESSLLPIQICRRLADRYQKWIDDRTVEAQDPSRTPPHLADVALQHLEQCRLCLTRMRRGIDQLESDQMARSAFALMNRAMLMQQIHYNNYATKPRSWVAGKTARNLSASFDPPVYEGAQNRWRPFQLAFILMTIPSIVLGDEEAGREREIVDVIWFPTGGGKTEAYLGLAAFAILWRRLVNPANAGTTVLMRYTLRLLTTQQFDRASSLICALERLRRDDPGELGTEAISIGLWVGGGVTPNRNSDAVKALNQMASGDGANPFVVLRCPWCGAAMGPVDDEHGRRRGVFVAGYRKLANPSRVEFACDDPACDFTSARGGLPLHVVDEQIYARRPTLVVGTVDKFAMLPWYPDARSIFGIDSDYDPPDVIIQDELHLISGPLGSMVGHYETLIDLFSRRDTEMRRSGAKIVASTATISRAPQQIAALYGRPPESAFLFPPQALKAGDSFFAEEREDSSGRLYVGVFASGLPSQITTQVRVIASLLQLPKLAGVDETSIDPYWTLVAYFNSIRELGHAATLVRSDIPERLAVLASRFGLSERDGEGRSRLRRWINTELELTSRVASSDITETLQALFRRHDQHDNAVDVCLATNMIQVGLDVPRLGLMVVVGQPKTTAEYIQATSRVGRSATGPGLVVDVLSTGKPRDRSHYEYFRPFHQAIYRHVEPTSVTPFSIRVRERALHAIATALVRFWDETCRYFPDPAPSSATRQRVIDAIMDRVRDVDPGEASLTGRALDEFFDMWEQHPPALYGTFGNRPEETPLMYPAGSMPSEDWSPVARETPSSMRNVDVECQAQPLWQYTDHADAGGTT